MNEIAQNIAEIKARMAEACKKAGRNPEEVKLLLATKTVSADRIKLALATGETLIGENKVQELRDKYEELKKVSGIPLKGDLLITAVGTIGKIWKVNYEKDFYFKDGNLIWLQLKNKNQFNTLSLKKILEDSIKNEKENLTSGSAYNALTIDKLKKFNIIIPPIELQNKFAERIEKIEKLKFIISIIIFKISKTMKKKGVEKD